MFIQTHIHVHTKFENYRWIMEYYTHSWIVCLDVVIVRIRLHLIIKEIHSHDNHDYEFVVPVVNIIMIVILIFIDL